MEVLQLNMYHTTALGVLALGLGDFINKRIPFLKKVCIPNPVTGGLVISILAWILDIIFGINISFNHTLQTVCMMLFFTTVGLKCNFKTIIQGGKPLLLMIFLILSLIICQNVLGIGLTVLLGKEKVLGMAAGSITMTGGHGTANGFASLLEGEGLTGATSITMAAATFGLLAGSLIGGPLGKSLIERNKLKPLEDIKLKEESMSAEMFFSESSLFNISIILVIAGVGTILNSFLTKAGITVPTYFGSMIVAITVRNVTEYVKGCPKLHMESIDSIGEVTLAFFLGMALATLCLGELAGIALHLMILLVAQVTFMYFFARYGVFNVLGRNYDAAVLAGGFCGFGLGATPNALANMEAICNRYGYTKMPFILVPVLGAAFSDIININIITFFINIV